MEVVRCWSKRLNPSPKCLAVAAMLTMPRIGRGDGDDLRAAAGGAVTDDGVFDLADESRRRQRPVDLAALLRGRLAHLPQRSSSPRPQAGRKRVGDHVVRPPHIGGDERLMEPSGRLRCARRILPGGGWKKAVPCSLTSPAKLGQQTWSRRELRPMPSAFARWAALGVIWYFIGAPGNWEGLGGEGSWRGKGRLGRIRRSRPRTGPFARARVEEAKEQFYLIEIEGILRPWDHLAAGVGVHAHQVTSARSVCEDLAWCAGAFCLRAGRG
jgi:hypothetical protein